MHPYRRIRTPTVIQMETVECGAVSLSIILRYYGRYVPLEELRVECAVSRDGSNALNLIQAAKKYGLQGSGYRKNFAELADLPLPAIVFWEYNHFLVLEGFGKNRVYINDPGTGPRYLSNEDFQKSYGGVVLVFEREEGFVKGGKPPSLIRQLYERLKGVQHPLVFFLWVGFLLLLPGFAFPAFLMVVIDFFFWQNILTWRWEFLGVVFITALFAGILSWMRQAFLNRLNGKLSVQFSTRFLQHLLQLPMSFYKHRYAGEIAYRMTLNDSVSEGLTEFVLSAAIDLLLVVFYGTLMFFYDAAIAWIGVIAALLDLGFMFWIYRSRENAYACLQQDLSKLAQASIGGLFHMQSIKGHGAESDFFSQWAGHYTNTSNQWQEIGKKNVILTTIPVFFQWLATAALLGIGAVRILEENLTMGMLMALQLLLMNFLQPIQRFIGLGQVIQNMSVEINRLDDVLRTPVDRMYRPQKYVEKKRARIRAPFEFRDVSFGYTPRTAPLIEGLSFTIPLGARLALVGPTGSGKSTVAKLASGLYSPWSGQIFYGGVPLEEIPRELLYNSIASVEQEIFLFAGSIRDNITLWNKKVPDAVLMAATQDAQIHEEILQRSGNYDSILIEEGYNLSGGQRQRLEIARAFLYDPSLLILDEATSHLDSITEKAISDNIKARGCSALMVAHRLSAIQDCDEILVLDRGKVVQRGTHQTLKEQEGLYRELVERELE